MDRESADADDAGPRPPGVRVSRRMLAAGLGAVVVLLGLTAVLAVERFGAPAAGTPAAATHLAPSVTPSLTVPDIYHRVAPSVVLVRTSRELGTGVIVADDG